MSPKLGHRDRMPELRSEKKCAQIKKAKKVMRTFQSKKKQRPSAVSLNHVCRDLYASQQRYNFKFKELGQSL